MPYENEHACRLNDPDKYKRIRPGKDRKHNGKVYRVLYGFFDKDGEETSEEQAYRYHKDIWSASSAKSHCKEHKGTFEAAKESDSKSVNEQGDTLKESFQQKFKPSHETTSKIIEYSSVERRIICFDDMELRVTDGDEPKIVGYAAKYGKWSEDLGGFKEKIRPGAFDEVLESDVRALKNHDPNLLLGRTASGTLQLTTNSVGLHFDIDPPDTSTGRDIIEEIRRKDITGCSFSFTTAEDDWKYLEDGRVERTIIKVGQLFDVGPVTYPAYPDTAVAVRSLDAFKEHLKKQKTEITEEDKQNELERKREIERKYRLAGRIINRNRPAEV